MKTYKNIASFSPQECLSGKISRIHRLTASIFRKYVSPFNLTNSQLTLLFILSKNLQMTQKQLSNIAKLEKSSLHRNLKRLIRQEYIDQKNLPQIQITEKGKSLVDAVIPEWEKAMNEIRELIGEKGESALNEIQQQLTRKM